MIGYFYTQNIKNQDILKDVVKPSNPKYEEIEKELSNNYLFTPNWTKEDNGDLTRVSKNLWAIVVWMRSCGVPIINEDTVDELLTRLKIENRLFKGEYTEDEIDNMRDTILKYSGLYTAVEGISRGRFMLEMAARL